MKVTLHIAGTTVTLEQVSRAQGVLTFSLNGKTYTFRSHALPDGSHVLERETAPGVWQRMQAASWQGKNGRHVQVGGLEAPVSELAAASAQAGGVAELSPRSPMPGLVRQILVTPGERVEAGQPLAVMEAMKLQLTLSSGAAGTVKAVNVREGQMIAEGVELVTLAADKEKGA